VVWFYLLIFKHNFVPKNVKKYTQITCAEIFSNYQTLTEFHNLNLKLCGKQYNKIDLLHLIVAPQLSGGSQHNYSAKTRQASRANEQSMYSLMSMVTL
jgi:hypothetical protein